MLRLRSDRLRFALLSALGTVSLACGGSTSNDADNGADGDGSMTAAGRSNVGGDTSTPRAGSSSAGTPASAGAGNSGGSVSSAGSGSVSSGGTGNLGGTGGAGGTVPGPGKVFACNNPSAPMSGFVQCDTGWTHRVEKQACASVLPRPENIGGSGGGAGQYVCDNDLDCTDKANGFCRPNTPGQPPGRQCAYGCIQDSECAAGLLCACGDPVGQCVPASCTVDSDCSGGALCASARTSGAPYCETTPYACQTPNDECMSDLDCAAPERCFVGTDGVRLCNVPLCTPGRPFLVDGAARLARATRRDGWRDAGAGPDLGALSPEARSELARAWTDAALMEHASIAAFARFALELLAFGAPAELVERTSRALADETRHAEQAFRLASAYAASPIGPSRLPLDGSLGAIDLEASALTTFLEGCVGESVAALEAAEALAHATDPAVREVLARVAAEEAEHAELAFRFVKWALERRGQTLAPRLSRALCELLSEPIPSFEAAETALERELLGHGVLPASRRAAVRRAALRDVVAPCLGTLLEAANASIPRAPATLSPS